MSRAIIVGLMVANSFLQKIAIPGTSGALPSSLLVIFILLTIGITYGRLVPLWSVAFGIASTAGILLACTGLSPGPNPSISGLALLISLLIPYGFAFKIGSVGLDFSIATFNNLAGLFAVFGIIQFTAQFVVGPDVAFWLDYRLAGDSIVAGFNNLNETGYLSGIYKANGIFLLEASLLNQFLCIAVLLELTTRRRLWMLAIYGGGIVSTYSGTGLIMLAVIAPLYLVRERHFGLVAFGIVVCLAIATFGDAIGLKLFLDRTDEFSSDQSSAFARFFSIFYLLSDYVWPHAASLLFGRGAGSVSENFSTVAYAAFDPSWGKVMYEYGAVGFVAYFSFLGYCMLRPMGSGYLKAALVLQFLFLGGYTSTTPVHIEILTMLYWPTMFRALVDDGIARRKDHWLLSGSTSTRSAKVRRALPAANEVTL